MMSTMVEQPPAHVGLTPTALSPSTSGDGPCYLSTDDTAAQVPETDIARISFYLRCCVYGCGITDNRIASYHVDFIRSTTLPLEYQNDIDKVENAKALSEEISYTKTEEGLLLSFPKEIDQLKIEGKVFLIRPSNKQLDFEMPISLSNHNLLIPDNRLLGGRWNIKIDWQYSGKNYLYKKEIIY